MEYPLPEYGAINVRQLGIVGDGETDCTKSLQQALDASNNALFFPPGRYVISRSLKVDLAGGRAAIRGSGATLVHKGPGPALYLVGHHAGSSRPATVAPGTGHEIHPIVDGIAIEGNHPEAEGIAFRGTFKSTISNSYIYKCRYGIHMIEHNRDVIISSCHIHDNSIGIYLDEVNLHQMNILGNHISHNGAGGIKIKGGAIRNIQINGNDIEYNHTQGGTDIWFVAGQYAIREGAIVGNTIQSLAESDKANVLIEGHAATTPNAIGFFSISGNHISGTKAANIHIKDSRGIAVVSNSIQGAHHNIIIENSLGVTCNQNNIDSHPSYQNFITGANSGSITLRNTRGCSLQGNTIIHPLGGSVECGGAIEAYNSDCLSISNCLILEPKHRGIWLEDVSDSIVTDCLIISDKQQETMLASIVEIGQSGRNIIANNRVSAGTDGAIMLASASSPAHHNLVG